MKNRLLLTVLAVAALMAPLMARAEVKVLTDAPLIQDIGACCNPTGSASDPRTCKTGQDAKCGWMTSVSEGAKWNPPVPVTAFKDTRGAHEEIGSITVECDAGQLPGNNDSGDYDIPSEVFLNDGTTNLINNVPTPTTCDITGVLGAAHQCLIPGERGRWTDCGGGSLNGTCCGNCALDTMAKRYTTTDGTFGFWFYNYGYNFDSACEPQATSEMRRLECFRTDPRNPYTVPSGTGSTYAGLGIYRGGANYVGCEAGGASALVQGVPSLLAPVNTTDPTKLQCRSSRYYVDDWVVGTLVDFVLPFGTRLANTLYPGIQLEGKNQFDQRMTGGTVQNQGGATSGVVYPAVVFRWEANHRKDGYGEAQDLPLPSVTMDRIKIFVPDILNSNDTTSATPSSYTFGENLYDTVGRIPTARNKVQGCYQGAGNQAVPDNANPPHLIAWDNQMPCNYDTTICIDIRGADPVYRENSPDIIARQVMMTVEDPLGTTYRPAVLVVAIIRARGTTVTGDFGSDPTANASCDAYTDCYWMRTATTSGGTTTIVDDYEPDKGDPGVMLLSWSDGIGPVYYKEKQGGFIQVDANATTLKSWTYIQLKLEQKGVEFVEIDNSALPNPNGTGPNCMNYVCPWGIVNGTSALPSGCTNSEPDPAGCDCSQVNSAGGVQVLVEPAGTGMQASVLRMSSTSIWVRITSPSSPSTPAKITIAGYNLKIDESALSGGMGCIEATMSLNMSSSGECRNHVGFFPNNDGDDSTNPNQQNTGAAPGNHMPTTTAAGGSKTVVLTCLTPGRTRLLYPYLVKAVGFDSGLVVTNTAGSPAIVHFYLYEEEGITMIDSNPAVSVLQQQDPAVLSKLSSDAAILALYDKYNEIPAYGQYVNLIFEYPGDPNTQKPKHGCQTEGSSGIFEDETLQNLCSPMGRVWVYAVVEQCYAHGYQMVFSAGGFGSTLALVDQDTEILPFGAPPAHQYAPRNTAGVTNGTKFLPVHMPPGRWHHDPSNLTTGDSEDHVYRYWNGNDN